MQKRISLAITSLFLAICSPGNCAEAVFSIDEEAVYLLTPKGLVEFNLPARSAHQIEPPSKFNPDADAGVSLSNTGYLLLVSGK